MQWSYEKKEKLIKRYQAGESVLTICMETGVAKSTFYSWLKPRPQIVAGGDNRISRIEFTKLKRENERLSKMIEILQRLDCVFTATPKEKLYALEKLYGQYEVRILCDAFGVDRGTYYNHVLRNKKKSNSYQVRRDELSIQIAQVYEESNQVFGARKIRVVLAEKGIVTSEKMVAELMQEMNLESIRLSAKKNYVRLNQNKRKKDVLRMNFSTKNPNEVWVSDVTYYRLKNKTYYICTIVDLFSRKVIAYKVSPRQSTQLLTAVFKEAYRIRNPKAGLIFHSDRGSIYTSYSFHKLLTSLGFKQSFSPSGKPCHNAVMESFFSTLKKEELYRTEYRSIDECKERLKEYIDFYNTKRPHSTLRYKTPEAYEEQYLEERDEKGRWTKRFKSQN